MKVGILTTSWPCRTRLWSGHFVADLAAGLATRGHEVVSVALCWRGDVLEGRHDVRVRAADVAVDYRPLPWAPEAWERYGKHGTPTWVDGSP